MELYKEFFAGRDYLADRSDMTPTPWRRRYTHVSQAIAARLFGLSKVKICRWVKSGVLPRNDKGLVALSVLEDLESRDITDEEIDELILASFHAHACQFMGRRSKRDASTSFMGQYKGVREC